MTTKTNGEPRQGIVPAAELLDLAKTPASSMHGSDRIMRKPVTENPITPMNEEDPQLSPLFPKDVGSEFRSRWDVIQKSFVDDPRRAVPRWR
jgi:hypothetical protein